MLNLTNKEIHIKIQIIHLTEIIKSVIIQYWYGCKCKLMQIVKGNTFVMSVPFPQQFHSWVLNL